MRDIEINDDPKFQHRTDRVQKVAWVLMALFVMASLAGWLGQSRFSTREAANDRVKVEYDAFVRRGTETELRIEVVPRSGDTEVAFSLPRRYLERVSIEKIFPEPARTEPTEDGVRFVYRTGGHEEAVDVVLTVVPQKPGRFRGEVSDLSSESPIEFDQLAYF